MISIIVPAHNEEGRLQETLEEYLTFFSKRNPEEFEIIVVPNGCVDRTPKIAENYSIEFPQVKCKIIEEHVGKGGAIIEGFKTAKGDIVSYTDADGATSPKELYRLIRELQDYDGVIGSRWLPGSKILVKQPLARRLTSRGFNLLVRILFRLPFRDTQCGAKVFRKRAIDKVINEIGITNFAFDIDLLYKLKERGCKIKEVPITWEGKEGSKVNLKKASVKMLLSVLGLRIKTSPLSFLAKSKLVKLLYRMVKNL